MQQKIKLKYFAAVFIVTVFIAVLTSSFAYYSLLTGRVWFVADVAFFLLLSATIIKYNPIKKNNLQLIFVSICGTILLLFDIRHIPALLHFCSTHDKIISDLRKEPVGKTIALKEFPQPDLTNQVELSPDPDNAENQLFCRFYGIKAKVSLEK